MHFGLFYLFPWHESKTQAQVYAEALEQIEYADHLGYDTVWLAEHHFTRYGLCPSLFVFASHVAARTKRIRIGTAVVVLPFYNPLLVAEEAAMVDVLSGGRLDFGVGRGYQQGEFRTFNLSLEDSRVRFNESLHVIRRAWTEEHFSHRGRYYTFNDAHVTPRPLQQPHPPIWVAASGTRETLDMAADNGFPILSSSTASNAHIKRTHETFRGALRARGRPDNVALPVNRLTYVCEPGEDPRPTLEPHVSWLYHILADIGRPERRAEMLANDYPHVDANLAIFGDPERCIQRIRYLRDFLDLNYLNLVPTFGGLDHRLTMRTLRLFAEQVMPVFREAPALALSGASAT